MFFPDLDSHSLQFLFALDFPVSHFLPCLPVGTAPAYPGVEGQGLQPLMALNCRHFSGLVALRI